MAEPGACVEVRESLPFNGALIVRINSEEERPLPLEVADHIYVEDLVDTALNAQLL